MSSNKIQLNNPYNRKLIEEIRDLEEELEEAKMRYDHIKHRLTHLTPFEDLTVLLRVRKICKKRIETIINEIKTKQSSLTII